MGNRMNVGRLKKLLETLPDDVMVLTGTSDHEYTEASVSVTTALNTGKNDWMEDSGEDVTPEADYGKRVQILLVN